MHVLLPAELERVTKQLHFDVCCKVIDQIFDCGCDRYAILRLAWTSYCICRSKLIVDVGRPGLYSAAITYTPVPDHGLSAPVNMY